MEGLSPKSSILEAGRAQEHKKVCIGKERRSSVGRLYVLSWVFIIQGVCLLSPSLATLQWTLTSWNYFL
jgi:hypothetical protein